jgi:hypothetical protein
MKWKLIATILTIVNEPAIVIEAMIPMQIPIMVVFPASSPKGFVISNIPIIHDTKLIASYLVNFSPIARNANIEVNIGEVNDKVVAIDKGLTW